MELIGHGQPLAREHVECGEECCHAIALVVMSHRRAAAVLEWRARRISAAAGPDQMSQLRD